MMKQFSWEISVLAIIIFVFLSGATLIKSQALNPNHLFEQGSVVVRELYIKVSDPRLFSLFKTFLSFFSIFFISVISYCAIKLLEIRKKEHAHLKHELEEYAHHLKEQKELEGERGVSKNDKWNKVLTYLFSGSSSDWKLAIIEADTMLEELTIELGFKGDTLGDRLKMASQETFYGLSDAWEAHTIRNKIAHEGLTFEISQHEAKRVVSLYEHIFHRYGFI